MGVDPTEVQRGDDSDEDSDDDEPQMVKLFKVSDASGELEVTQVAEGPLQQDMLDQSVSNAF